MINRQKSVGSILEDFGLDDRKTNVEKQLPNDLSVLFGRGMHCCVRA